MGQVVVVVAQHDEVRHCVRPTVRSEAAVVDVQASVAADFGGESHRPGTAVAVAFKHGFVDVLGHGRTFHVWYTIHMSSNGVQARSATFGGKVCQYCRLIFETTTEKLVHATLEHAGETPIRFRLCPCSQRVFFGQTCPDCGTFITDGR